MKNSICIEGVVGAGKTTIGEILAKELDIHFFQEPYFENPFLDKFYRDKERYSFLSQMYFLNKRIDIIEISSQLKDISITDRSIFGDYIFAKMHLKNSYMSKDEFKLYEEYWNKFVKTRKKPILIIYLEISTENAIKRIVERGRSYELDVDKIYWENLNKEYSNFFNNLNDMEIIKINIDNLDIRDNIKDREYFINLVKKRLNNKIIK